MATLNDVAREAGVSPMTVSRVMNGSAPVKEATRRRVQEAAERLRYQPNLLARSLSADRMHTIGVAVTAVENPMYSLMVSGIYREAALWGYDVMISCSHDPDSSCLSLLNLLNKRVSALAVLPVEYHNQGKEALDQIREFKDRFPELIEKYAPEDLPMVSVGRQLQEGVNARVIEDYEAGAVMAVEYLAQKGHRRIGMLSHICCREGIWGERMRGFERAAAAGGMEVRREWIVYSEEDVSSAREAMDEMLSADTRPDAVYCANDVMAAGAYQALNRRGIRVPEEISVIGHDGRDFTELLHPALTTVAIDPVNIGREVVKNLTGQIPSGKCPKEGKGERAEGSVREDILLKPRLLERASVAQLS